LTAIAGFITDNGYAPTVREIGELVGLKQPNGVLGHLRALEKKGYIQRGVNKSRAMRVVSAGPVVPPP
jgi:repressor LexA